MHGLARETRNRILKRTELRRVHATALSFSRGRTSLHGSFLIRLPQRIYDYIFVHYFKARQYAQITNSKKCAHSHRRIARLDGGFFDRGAELCTHRLQKEGLQETFAEALASDAGIKCDSQNERERAGQSTPGTQGSAAENESARIPRRAGSRLRLRLENIYACTHINIYIYIYLFCSTNKNHRATRPATTQRHNSCTLANLCGIKHPLERGMHEVATKPHT